jgi:hypothetical protein
VHLFVYVAERWWDPHALSHRERQTLDDQHPAPLAPSIQASATLDPTASLGEPT